MKIIEGEKRSRAGRYGIVVARFNDFITRRLLDGCLKELGALGVKPAQITVVRVPGSFELPLAARRLARKKAVTAVICLGCVIRGETFHFELVAREAAAGIAAAGRETGKPVIFGVVTAETVQQAERRSEPDGENRGRDAARAAVEMVNTLKKL